MSNLPYDPRSITRLLNIALAGAVLRVALYFSSNYLSLNFLAAAEMGTQTDSEFATAAEFEERQSQILSIIGVLLLLFEFVVFMVWIYRTSANAAALRPDTERITSGWAVGWFFIPLANLWMPFKALNQVWHSSSPRPQDLNAPFPGIMSAFTAALIVDQLINRVAGRMIARAEDMDAYRTALQVGNFAGVIDLISIAITYMLAKQICAAQVASASRIHSDTDMQKGPAHDHL